MLPDNSKYENLAERAVAARKVAKQMGLSDKYCLLVDYSLPSGTPRMFVWSFDEWRVVARTYVMHGPGNGSTDEKPVFSNKPGSNCSSLGWYLVDRSVGVSVHYGYKYHAVDGKDATNSNARRRQILIHPYIAHLRIASTCHDNSSRGSRGNRNQGKECHRRQ